MKRVFLEDRARKHRLSRQQKEDSRLRRQAKQRARRLRDQNYSTNQRVLSALEQKKLHWGEERKKFTKQFYRSRPYDKLPTVVKIDGELGLEKDIDAFMDTAQQFLDCESKQIRFDLSACSRLWPSGVTLLSSLKHWCELTASAYPPYISSTTPKDQYVDWYLEHCGFYAYVQRRTAGEPSSQKYSDDEIVKIKRESTSDSIESEQEAIRSLVERHGLLSGPQVEEFDCVVLSEILNNVTEHGVNNRDFGWYAISQYHKTHGMISVCIADNGIGIKNTLSTGPQGKELLKYLPKKKANDGDYIRKALEENVSGAREASVKEGVVFPRFERGSRRGNGLKRVRTTCKDLGVAWSILSQRGYATVAADGTLTKVDTRLGRIFSGTLYHLLIPAKKVQPT